MQSVFLDQEQAIVTLLAIGVGSALANLASFLGPWVLIGVGLMTTSQKIPEMSLCVILAS